MVRLIGFGEVVSDELTFIGPGIGKFLRRTGAERSHHT